MNQPLGKPANNGPSGEPYDEIDQFHFKNPFLAFAVIVFGGHPSLSN
jgi:hypothetical protein